MTHKLRLMAASFAFALFAFPALASAASLTSIQANAIVQLLQAFGATQSVILQVEQALNITSASSPAAPVLAPAAIVDPNHVPATGSVYRTSNLGFDYSYNAPQWPDSYFSFGIVGVNGGKSFTQNPRINQEYSWAQFGGGTPPTVYMNLNAPYGTSVAGHVSSPKSCSVTADASGEPTACAGYNYGYQAAQYAYTYAKGAGVTSPIWWLDIEEANSWSADTSVNDQVIQGAIDYLNAQGLRAGIYSMPYMWNNIAGKAFVPTQVVNGQAESLPNWLPIGITDQVGAANVCVTTAGFITGSPVWLVQYEASAVDVDKNLAC